MCTVSITATDASRFKLGFRTRPLPSALDSAWGLSDVAIAERDRVMFGSAGSDPPGEASRFGRSAVSTEWVI